jgi:nicotinamidase-related amidase
MSNEYTKPVSKHSALLIIDVQHDFTLKGGSAEIPGTLRAVSYIKSLVEG